MSTNFMEKYEKSMGNERFNKQEAYDFLLTVEVEARDGYIKEINSFYAYEVVNKHELARYEILLNNTDVEHANSITDFIVSNRPERPARFYEDKMKELQKGYMLLMSV